MPSPDPPSSLLVEQGVHLIGDFSGRCSQSQVGRDIVEVIRSLGIPVEVLDLPLSPERARKAGKIDMEASGYRRPKSSVSIICWNADVLPRIVPELPREIFEDRFIVGIWYWETEILPEEHVRGFDYVDEVWVTSKFLKETIAKNAPVPVRYLPHFIRLPQLPPRLVLPESLRNDRFVFLFCFDFRSMSLRKNPEGLCQAFIQAFPESRPDGPLCVVKSVAGRSDKPLEYVDLRLRFRHRADIIFIDGWLPLEERDCLMARADCYASLHHAEGLGLTLMESMALGKPCITTAYSGNMDFTTEENSWLIPYKMVRIGPNMWPYPADHCWADPDLDAAAEAMREAVADPETLGKKGRLSLETIRLNHNLEIVGARLCDLLEGAIRSQCRIKAGLSRNSAAPATSLPAEEAPVSGRSQAYEILKRSKVLEKQIREQLASLHTMRLPRKAKECMEGILELVRLQQQVQSKTLLDLGMIKKRIKGYDGSMFDSLVREHQLIGRLLANMVDETEPPSAGI